MVDISVVIPVKDEAGNVATLLDEVRTALAGRTFEVIFVDDGSTDGTAEALLARKSAAPELRIIRHSENCGQSSAIRTGIFGARRHVSSRSTAMAKTTPRTFRPCLPNMRGQVGARGWAW